MPAALAKGIRLPLLAAALALAIYPALLANAYGLRVLTLAGIYALLVIGYQFVFGHAGAFSLAQGAFFGLGAYVSGILASDLGWSFPLAFPLAVAAPALLAACVAVPVLRLESHYFALATLGLAQVVLLAALDWQGLTGGANGIAAIPAIAAFGVAVPDGWPLLLLVWAFVALGGLLAWQLMRGLYGSSFRVMRESTSAAACLGIDAARLRFAAFLLSAAYAGAAGALYAHAIGVISPSVLEFPVMVACLAMAVVGGATRVAGAILGAVLLVHLPEWFRPLEGYYLIAYGAALLAVITAAPSGLVGAAERLRARLMPEPPPACPAPATTALRPREAASGAPLLELERLGIAFGGVRALGGVSLAIREGELVGLIGPNGSGKTTLVNLVTGLYRPREGRIRFAGRDVTGAPAHRLAQLGIARSFQSVELVPQMTALDNVALGRAALEGAGLRSAFLAGRLDRQLARARAHAMALLYELGIAAHAGRAAGELPHGTRRLVEIARALALEPRLLILDEPAAGLGEAAAAALGERLERLMLGGTALLVVEHDMPFLLALARRVICLADGRVIAEGTPAEMREHPRVIEAYLGRSAEPGGLP